MTKGPRSGMASLSGDGLLPVRLGEELAEPSRHGPDRLGYPGRGHRDVERDDEGLDMSTMNEWMVSAGEPVAKITS